jgi:cell division septation protein DedD
MSDDMSQENESTMKDDEIQSEVSQSEGKKKQFYSINLTTERVFLIFVLLVAIIAVVVVAVVFSTSSKPVTKNKDVASEEVIDEIVSNDDFAFFDDENTMELLDGESGEVTAPEKVTLTEGTENTQSTPAAEVAKPEIETQGQSSEPAKVETVAAKPEVKIDDKVSYSSSYSEKEEKAAATTTAAAAAPQPVKKNAVETKVVTEKKVTKAAANQKRWVIQIGSFTSEKSANDVAAFYKKDNYPAYVKEFMKDGKTYYRLRIGPYDSDSKAQEALVKVKASKYGKDSFVSVGYF